MYVPSFLSFLRHYIVNPACRQDSLWDVSDSNNGNSSPRHSDASPMRRLANQKPCVAWNQCCGTATFLGSSGSGSPKSRSRLWLRPNRVGSGTRQKKAAPCGSGSTLKVTAPGGSGSATLLETVHYLHMLIQYIEICCRLGKNSRMPECLHKKGWTCGMSYTKTR